MIYLYTITRQLPPIVIDYYMSNMRLSNCECFLAIENTITKGHKFRKEKWSSPKSMVSDGIRPFVSISYICTKKS